MWSESDGERELQEHEVDMGRSSAGSELVMMDSRAMPSSSWSTPGVANLNVTKFSKVHIGNKFVTQNVHNSEVVKGRILGLELVSPINSRRLRCSIAVFVCWAFVVASGLAFYLFYFAFAQPPIRLDTGLNETWYLRRLEWQSMPEYMLEGLKLPLKCVIIGHSGEHYCKEKYTCIKVVLEIQRDHLRRDWDDIGPNYLIGGNGIVFEGRGANIVGAMVLSYNHKCISVMFIGNYALNPTVKEQFDHLRILLKQLVKQHVLVPDYTVRGHCQVAPSKISPGRHVMEGLKNFTHWDNKNEDGCIN